MSRYFLMRNALGGSDVFDESGNRVGYSLPGVLGDGEDFFDVNGNPAGQSFGSVLGGESFTGPDGFGFMDEEIMMGRNAWLEGDPFHQGGDE